MLTRKLCTTLIAAAAMLGSCLILTAQDGDPISVGQPWQVARGYSTYRPVPSNLNSTSVRWLQNNVEQRMAVEVAVNKLKQADSDEAKSTAKRDLRKVLVADYEDKMNRYDEHLEKLEKELEAMRERLSRRRAAKEDMVDLKLKEIVANADGLGWPSGPTAQQTGIFNNAYPPQFNSPQPIRVDDVRAFPNQVQNGFARPSHTVLGRPSSPEAKRAPLPPADRDNN